MKLQEYVDIEKLEWLIDNGYVSVKTHNEFPLRIYNYTKRASSLGFNHWPGTLEKCRGLIVDDQDEIQAFGLRKFWNYVEGDGEGMSFSVYDKIDGSIGIVYQWDGKTYISTRGSFHSEMADWANDFLDRRPDYRWFLTAPVVGGSPFYTPHVEIVYNENRIVVDYDYQDLVLLGYNDDVSWTPAMQHWRYPGRKAQKFSFDTLDEVINSETRQDAEGFVIQFDDGSMKKIKYYEYLELQRAMINMTEKAIYNKLIVSEQELNDWILGLPNELQAEAYAIRDQLKRAYDERYVIAHTITAFMGGEIRKLGGDHRDAKTWALHMQENNVPGWIRTYVFAILNKNDRAVKAVLWKQVKP